VQVTEITDPVSQISCGPAHSVAVTTKGKVWVMGSNEIGELGIG